MAKLRMGRVDIDVMLIGIKHNGREENKNE